MTAKNPTHPSVSIQADLDEMGWSIDEFADELGVSRDTIEQLMHGQCGISPIVALALWSVVKLPRHSGESRNPRISVRKSFCGIEPFWIPAFAGMTEMKLSHVWQFNLTTLPRGHRLE